MDASIDNRTVWYRTKAAQCERWAKEARDPEAKRDFIEVAREWRDLAAQVERHGW